MKSDILFMFKLLAAVVTKGALPEQDSKINWENIYKISNAHNLSNIIAYGILKGDYDVSGETKALFKKKMYERIAVCENQNADIDKLLALFEENNISFMPLKGILLQNLYPSRDMRFMADADVLIKCKDYDKINSLMLGLGYEFKGESDHEFIYSKKPFTTVELHKHLIPTYNEDLYEYLGDGWEIAQLAESYKNRFVLTTEDNFVYIFTHFAKHYRDSGCGIRPLLDMWLYMRKYDKMYMPYINDKLQKLNLYDFYENVNKLLECWFGDRQFDEITSQMTMFILNSGHFGSIRNAMSAKSIRENENIKDAEKLKYINAVFLPYKKMKNIFPVLQKLPFLLPFLWIWRVIRFVLFRSENFQTHKKRIDSIDTESINQYDIHMKTVGLDIYNGRKRD